jgi:hypothetical protein
MDYNTNLPNGYQHMGTGIDDPLEEVSYTENSDSDSDDDSDKDYTPGLDDGVEDKPIAEEDII